MTYRDLGRPRDGPYEIFEIHEAQVVARIDIQTAFSRTFSRHHIRPHRILAAALVPRRISLRIKLHPVGTAGGSPLRHLRVRVNENRRSDAARLEFLADLSQEIPVFQCIPAGIGRDDILRVRNQCDLRRDHLIDKVDELRNRIPFNVHFHVNKLFDGSRICISYMPLIRPRMYCDTFCAESHAIHRRLLHVRHIAATRIADSGNLVDVDTQFCHNRIITFLTKIDNNMQKL